MKGFLINIFIFILLVAVMQIAVVRYFKAPIPEISRLDRILEDQTDIVYLGDSIIRTADKNDTSTSSIVDMILARHPSIDMADFSHPAYHPGVYDAIMDYISRSGSKPKAIVVPINLRSFTTGWDMAPTNQFEREIFYFSSHIPFETYFYRPLAIFRYINIVEITQGEYDEMPVYYGKDVVGKVADYKQLGIGTPSPGNLKNMYIYGYMQDLDGTERKMNSLRDMIRKAKESGVELYPYITPIDYMGGTKSIGPDFVTQTDHNAQIVCHVFEEADIPCLNLAFALGSSYFSHEAFLTEHLRENGRQFVAEAVYSSFLKMNPNK